MIKKAAPKAKSVAKTVSKPAAKAALKAKPAAKSAPKSAAKPTGSSAKPKAMPIGDFFGRLYAFNNSLKLYHWHVTGPGSYAEHIALDQALESLPDALDRIVETTYALNGDIAITIPECKVPGNIVRYCEDMYKQIYIERKSFDEDFLEAILDDYQEAIQQLLYRLKRLR